MAETLKMNLWDPFGITNKHSCWKLNKRSVTNSVTTVRLTVVLSQDEAVHAPQSKHVQEVPGRRTHPAYGGPKCPIFNTLNTCSCIDTDKIWVLYVETQSDCCLCCVHCLLCSFQCWCVPGGVQRQQVYPSLQHRLEPQSQRERHLSCTTTTNNNKQWTNNRRLHVSWAEWGFCHKMLFFTLLLLWRSDWSHLSLPLHDSTGSDLLNGTLESSSDCDQRIIEWRVVCALKFVSGVFCLSVCSLFFILPWRWCHSRFTKCCYDNMAPGSKSEPSRAVEAFPRYDTNITTHPPTHTEGSVHYVCWQRRIQHVPENWFFYWWKSKPCPMMSTSDGWRTHWWRIRRKPSWSIHQSQSWAGRWSGFPSSCLSTCWSLKHTQWSLTVCHS